MIATQHKLGSLFTNPSFLSLQQKLYKESATLPFPIHPEKKATQTYKENRYREKRG